MSLIKPTGGQFYINGSSNADNNVDVDYSDGKKNESKLDNIKFNSKKFIELNSSTLSNKNSKSSNNSSSIHASKLFFCLYFNYLSIKF